MSVSVPPRPPGLDELPPLDQDALIKEARRRARRRRLRNLSGILAAMLGALWLYSLVGGGGPESGSAFLSESRAEGPPKTALPEELSFTADNGIVLVHRDGTRRDLARGAIRRGPKGGWRILRYFGVEWAPDGSKLLALRWRSHSSPALVVIAPDGKASSTVASPATDGRWSPDGTRIAFVRHERGAGRVLYVTSSDGRTLTRVAARLQIFGTFSWSPDGTELAYVRQGSPGILIADAGGRGTPRRLAIDADAGAPATRSGTVAWSPDGSLIAFTTTAHVYVVRPDGTSLRQVTTGDGYGLAWSPDSRLLTVLGPAGVSGANVSVIRSDGTVLRRLAGCGCGLRGPGFSPSVAWSSDGSRIAYVSGRGNTVSTIRRNGSGAAVVARQQARGLTGSWYPGTPLWRPGRHA